MFARKILRVAALLAVLILSLAGCASSPPNFDASPAARTASMAEVVVEESAAGDAAAFAADTEAAQVPVADLARKIIARATMTLIVDDTAQAVDAVESMLADVNGYLSDANLYVSSYAGGELLRGTLTVRVPAAALQPFMTDLRTLALDVRAETITREDVTDQYSDVEAQLRNLEAAEDELLALLAEVRERPDATSEDILAIYSNITQLRGQIEQLQGRKNMLDNLVGLSTLTLELIPDALNQPVLDSGWRPAVVVRDAVRALVNTLEMLGSFAIWFVIYALPLLLLVLVPIAIIVWLLRKLLQRFSRQANVQESTE